MNKLKFSSNLFYMAFIIWVITYVFNQTSYWEMITNRKIILIVRGIVYLLLYFKFLLDESYSIKTLLALFFMGIIFFITINSRQLNIWDTFLFIYSARNLDLKKIIKITLILQVILMIFIIMSSMIGVIPNYVWYREDYSPRYGLGYNYTSFCANYFFHIVLMYTYLKEDKTLRLIECICIFIINFIIYYLTDTKAVFYLVNIIILIIYFIDKKRASIIKDSFIKRSIYKYCFPICATVSIIFTINYNNSNSMYLFLNKLLTGRLALGKSAYENFHFKLFGQIIPWITAGDEQAKNLYNYVDSSYVNILINFGVVILILLCWGMVIIGREAINKNQHFLCIVLVALSIHSITDPQFIELGYNPFLLLLSIVFLQRGKKKIIIRL